MQKGGTWNTSSAGAAKRACKGTAICTAAAAEQHSARPVARAHARACARTQPWFGVLCWGAQRGVHMPSSVQQLPWGVRAHAQAGKALRARGPRHCSSASTVRCSGAQTYGPSACRAVLASAQRAFIWLLKRLAHLDHGQGAMFEVRDTVQCLRSPVRTCVRTCTAPPLGVLLPEERAAGVAGSTPRGLHSPALRQHGTPNRRTYG